MLATEMRKFLLHPLPLYNNSIGVHDSGLMQGAMTASQMVMNVGGNLHALYIAGSFLPEHLRGNEEKLASLDFVVVQELFETETTAYADVVFPAASFAESDGTFTNNDGFVQRVRASIPPVHQSRQDWMITSGLAQTMGVDFNFQMAATAVFREIAERVPAYAGLRYPLLKDESKPVQAKHTLAGKRDIAGDLEGLRITVESLTETGDKITQTPEVGHELFKPGTLTGRVPQFNLLAAGNPKPESVLVSPLYQITIDSNLSRDEAVAAD
jgi:anaerobic selenocysteine-containing dehydrogenase